MRRPLVLTAALATCLLAPMRIAAATPASVTCPQNTQAFTGTAYDLVVPADGYCDITSATIVHNLVVDEDAGADIAQSSIGNDAIVSDEGYLGPVQTTIGRDLFAGSDTEEDLSQVSVGRDFTSGPESALHLELTTIGHDLIATEPQTVQTSRNGPDTPGGPVNVLHDFVVSGAPDLPFVFDGICSLKVGHDLRVTNRAVTLGIGLGPQCAGQGKAADTIGHDLVFTGNTALVGFVGPSQLAVGADHIGHDLVFSGNNAPGGGALVVSGNTVGHDAVCSGNAPATTGGGNVAAHANSCG